MIAYTVSFAASLLQALFLPVLSLYASSLSFSEAEAGAIAGAGTFLYVPVALLSEPIIRTLGYRRPAALALTLIAAGYASMLLAREPLQLTLAVSFVSLGYGIFWPCVEKAVSICGGSATLFSISWSAGSLAGALTITPLLGLSFKTLYSLCAAVALALAPLPLKFEKCEVGGSSVGPDPLSLWRSWLLCVGYSTSAGGLLTFYPLFAERSDLPSYSVSLTVFSMMVARTATFYALRWLRAPPLLGLPLLLAPAVAPLFGDPFSHALLAAAAGAGQSFIYMNALEEVFNAGGAYTSLFEAAIGLGYSLGPLLGATASLVNLEPLVAAAAAASLISLVPLSIRRSGS